MLFASSYPRLPFASAIVAVAAAIVAIAITITAPVATVVGRGGRCHWERRSLLLELDDENIHTFLSGPQWSQIMKSHFWLYLS